MREALSAEDELCLCLARGELSPEVRGRALELVATPLRWDLVLQRAREHQVLPLIYRSLRLLEFPAVPPGPRARLTQAFRANALRNEFLSQELARVLGLLDQAHLAVIPLKGVTLAAALYGDAAYRVCADLDILVPADQTLRARRLLLENGYTSPFTEEYFLEHLFPTGVECILTPKREVPAFVLEIHWTVLNYSTQDDAALQDLWRLAQPGEFLGRRACSLTPEWLFLYLAGHAAYHKWPLRWLADLHELCLAPQMDWALVKEKSARFGLGNAVGATLTACSTLLGTPVPAPLACRPLPPGVRLFPHAPEPEEEWMTPLFRTRLLARPWDKVRWLAQTLFVPRLTDRLIFPLPPALSFLYYLLRPLRLTCKAAWLFLRTSLHRLRRGT
jgi:hypothetical protein